MKKNLGILLIALLILGAGTAVFAAEKGEGQFTFEQMLPFMQKMHPGLSKEQLEQMYDACHGNDFGHKSSSIVRGICLGFNG